MAFRSWQATQKTAYVRINPQGNAKKVIMEIGFYYGGRYYMLGYGEFDVAQQGIYHLVVDITKTSSPFGNIIPEGSYITLRIEVDFFRSLLGTFFLYYGPSQPSNMELY